MNSEQRTATKPRREQHFDGVPPPSRWVWLSVGLLSYAAVVGLISFLAYRTEQRLISLVPVGIGAVAFLVVCSFIGAVLFRRSLPRHLWLWILISIFVLIIAGSLGGILFFQQMLLPQYQEAVAEQMPFMRVFMPPTPQGGVLPTSAPSADNAISPQDLLSAPLIAPLTSTPTETAAALTQQAAILVEPSATPTATLTNTPTAIPSSTPETQPQTQTNAGSVSAQDVLVSLPSHPPSARLFGLTHVRQKWNGCGPANITMGLSYFGWREDQSVAAAFLKPDSEDKNVNPGEMVAFVNERTQVRAVTRMGGDLTMLKEFLAAQFPVIIETSYRFEGYDWIGHYQTLVGYDDAARVFYLYDSYLGPGENGAGVPEDYSSLDDKWQDFNRTFIVIYPPDREAEVSQLLGVRSDLVSAAENALRIAQEEARANPQDPFAWYNMGTALVKLGRFNEAEVAYDQSRRVGVLPWRITWYQHGIFEAYYEVGRYDDVLALVQANLNNGAQYVEETHYWEGKVRAAQGDTQGAARAFRRALVHNPRYSAAQQALDSLNA